MKLVEYQVLKMHFQNIVFPLFQVLVNPVKQMDYRWGLLLLLQLPEWSGGRVGIQELSLAEEDISLNECLVLKMKNTHLWLRFSFNLLTTVFDLGPGL